MDFVKNSQLFSKLFLMDILQFFVHKSIFDV